MRVTKQRQVILDALKQTKSHPTADELYSTVRAVLPHISLGTVYRNLELLSESGQIQKLNTGSSQKRFDYDCSPHLHFRCRACGSVEDVPAAVPNITLDTGHWGEERVVEKITIEMQGICPLCRTKTEGYEL